MPLMDSRSFAASCPSPRRKTVSTFRMSLGVFTGSPAMTTRSACMPGAIPLVSGAFCTLGALGARDALAVLLALAGAPGLLRRGAALRAGFRTVFRCAVRGFGRLGLIVEGVATE